MTKPDFIKPEFDQDLNPVDYYNQYGSWKDAFKDVKNVDVDDNDRIIFYTKGKRGEVDGVVNGIFLTPPDGITAALTPGKHYTKFMILTKFRFRCNYKAAMTYVEHKRQNAHIPYIRVGCDYFRINEKLDRYGVIRKVLKGWKKDELKQDEGAKILHHIPLFDDFCIVPNNTEYESVIGNCYNLYAPFNHIPAKAKVTDADIPVSLQLLRHLFGEQFEIGLKYMQCLYQHPTQALPILCLVSSRRQTGKTTFLNWLDMIFSDNFLLINPEELTQQFNSNYANKNIIGLDETVIDKTHTIEKLKSLATAKSISVNPKFVQSFSIPFYGKIIICTNKETDFMRIDEEEIRFWIRQAPDIPDAEINTNIEQMLREEIPFFLKYLNQLPKIDTSRSRMVFTAKELYNGNLQAVQRESWSNLRKEISFYVEDFFHSNSLPQFMATPTDVKERFFNRNNTISINYIHKVIKDELKLKFCGQKRYHAFDNDPMIKKVGKPFLFKRSDFQVDDNLNDDIPF